MSTRTVIISTKKTSPMSLSTNGSPRVKSTNFTTLSSFYYGKDGEKKKFIFLDQYSNESPLNINPTVQFNLGNKIDSHNYNTLLVYMKVYKNTADLITIIDPEKENEDFIQAEEKTIEAKAYLFKLNREKSHSTIADIVRVKTLSVEGRTSQWLYAEAIKIAQNEPEYILSFKKKDANKYKIMAAKAVECGVLVVETQTGYVRYAANRELVAESMEKFEFKIENDEKFRISIESAVENYVLKVNSAVVEETQDDIESLLNVGISIEEIISSGSSTENLNIDDVKPVVNAAITAEAFQLVDGKYKIPSVSGQPFDIDGLCVYYSVNPKEFEILKNELANAGIILKD